MSKYGERGLHFGCGIFFALLIGGILVVMFLAFVENYESKGRNEQRNQEEKRGLQEVERSHRTLEDAEIDLLNAKLNDLQHSRPTPDELDVVRTAIKKAQDRINTRRCQWEQVNGPLPQH